MKVKYKAELERILTVALRRKEPLLSKVQISDDCKFAVIQIAEKYWRPQLTAFGKKFLRTGSLPAVGNEAVEDAVWRLSLEGELPF